MNKSKSFPKDHTFGLAKVWDEVANLTEVLIYPMTKDERSLLAEAIKNSEVFFDRKLSEERFIRYALRNYVNLMSRQWDFIDFRKKHPESFDFAPHIKPVGPVWNYSGELPEPLTEILEIPLSKEMMEEYEYLRDYSKSFKGSRDLTFIDWAIGDLMDYACDPGVNGFDIALRNREYP